MNEWLMISSISVSAILFPAGGTHIPVIGGQKWLRRELLPALLGLIFYFAGFAVWKIVLFVIAQDISFRLPYGERTKWWIKAFVFCGFVIPSTILGLTFWQLVAPAVILLMFFLSNFRKTAKEVPHKIWEASAGFLIGVVCAMIISGLPRNL
jgi:hypothetical protein